MKKSFTIFFLLALSIPSFQAQNYFRDDFEGYNVGDYLGDVSPNWTTWSGSTGGSEDIRVVNTDYYSGGQSIYYDSPFGGGPQDIVLPFGGVHNSGKFKFSMMMKIPKGNSSYFNFQGGASVGSSWAMEVYFYDDATFSVNKLFGSYPVDQWFEVKVEINFNTNNWELFIDGTSQGSFSSGTNAASYLDIYGANPSASFWVDDVQFCVDNYCNPDIVMDDVTIAPSPLCTNHPADVTLHMYNNGPQPATGFTLGLDMPGQSRIKYAVVLNNLLQGGDTTITIPGLFKTGRVGSNLQVMAINIDHDSYEFNDTAYTKITTNPSPSGSSFVNGSTFQGRSNVGTQAQPDVLEIGKTNQYELTPPTGYNNSGYSTSWKINSIVVTTAYGTVVPPSAYTVTPPSGSNNGKISITGSTTYLDSNLTFSYTISTTGNGCDSIIKRTLRIVPTPLTGFKFPSSICVGDDVPFDNLTTIHSGQVTYDWDFGDGQASDNTNPVHTYTTKGTYQVTLKATSQPYGIEKDTTISISVGEIPTAAFKPFNKCYGVAVTFQNNSSISSGAPITYDWNFGDLTAHSTAANPSHLYTNPGPYKVTLVASANGCSASVTRNAYTFARPVANFVPPGAPVCAGSPAMMVNTTTILSGNVGASWNFGDGTLSTVTDGQHAYAAAGTYPVKLIAVSEFGCSDSVTKSVAIKATPAPSFTTSQFCSKQSTNFANTTLEAIANPSYEWTFSDNFTSIQKSVTRNWSNEGPYTVTLKATYINGCSASTTTEINVLSQAKASFTVNDICSGETANFVNKTVEDKAGLQYNWNFGNSATSTLRDPQTIYNPTSTSTYTVSLIASYPGGCNDTMRKTITVSEAPVCDFSSKGLGFLNMKFTPSNANYTKYQWLFGEGGSSSSVTPVYQYYYSGNFNVTMKATNDAGCSCQVTKRISATTGVNDISAASGISIYPNPSNGVFTISGSQEGMQVEVFSVLGSKVYSNATDAASMEVNLDGQAAGMYLVKVTVNGVTTTANIVIN